MGEHFVDAFQTEWLDTRTKRIKVASILFPHGLRVDPARVGVLNQLKQLTRAIDVAVSCRIQTVPELPCHPRVHTTRNGFHLLELQG